MRPGHCDSYKRPLWSKDQYRVVVKGYVDSPFVICGDTPIYVKSCGFSTYVKKGQVGVLYQTYPLAFRYMTVFENVS